MPVTVLLMTPLPLEYAAISRHLTDRKAVVKDGAAYETGRFDGQHHAYTIVVREPGMKNIDMALATERAIQHWSPDIAILCGIAGGIKDVQKGDVAIAKSAFNYDSGKESDNGFLPRPVEYHFSEELLAYAQLVQRSDDWKKHTSDGASTAQVHIASVAAGDKVVAAVENATYERITQFLSHCKFLEMEAAGFGLAVQRHRNVHALVVRGISDLCKAKSETDKEEENWQERAAERAAAVAIEVLWILDGKSILQTKPVINVLTSPQTPTQHLRSSMLKIFISYAQEDIVYRESLNNHLSSFRRTGQVEMWSDNQVNLGATWNDVTKERLRQADIIILLLSDSFMASDHIWETQLQESLKRRNSGEAVMLIPILVRPCNIKNTVLDTIQGLPRNKKPILLHPNIDQAWYEVAIEIGQIVEKFDEMIKEASYNASKSNIQQVLGENHVISKGVIVIRENA